VGPSLFLISDFKLDVESPYSIPTRETLKAKPERLSYPKKYPKFNHLGKNIEVVINKALREENPEKRQGFANAIAYYMKLTYSNWHIELVHDDNIQSELQTITEGQLEFNNRPFVKHRRITVPTVMITGAVAQAGIGRTMVLGIMPAAGITGAVVAANVTIGEELEEAATTAGRQQSR
jgi:hypothetical protein